MGWEGANLEISADEEEVDLLRFFTLETGEGGVDCVEFAVTAAFDGDFHFWKTGTVRAVGEGAWLGDEGEEFGEKSHAIWSGRGSSAVARLRLEIVT
jgi:hypothetical protein